MLDICNLQENRIEDAQYERFDEMKSFYFQWHFIESCNLRCIHCYQKGYAYNDAPRDEIFQIADKIEKTLSKWGRIGRISLTGGEPFLRKDLLYDLLNFFNQSNDFYWIGILTNGTLIDDITIEELKQFNKLREIQISLDGSNADAHDKVRGIGSFAKAIEAIRKLKDKGFFVSVMFTLHNINKDEALAVIDLSLDLRVDAITIERITPMDEEDIEKLYISPEELREIYNKIYQKKVEVEERIKIRVSRPLWTLIDDKLGGFCPVGLTSLCIMHDGTVLPCRRMDIPLGNVVSDGLFKIWYTSEILWKLRNKKLLSGKCNGCQLLANCGGCRAIAYKVNGDYMAEDPQCWK